MNTQLTPERLCRRAVVYVRQSTPGQVLRHTESKRLQYGLAERARQLGFTEVRIIDDDLGRSADGKVDRPGFEHLVAEVCSETSVRCFAWKPHAWPAMAATGTT
jgi:DNA invertase Pin-like site-specific DNA recombinase